MFPQADIMTTKVARLRPSFGSMRISFSRVFSRVAERNETPKRAKFHVCLSG
jgi:hypothetical protein